jgi:hypothetical protein
MQAAARKVVDADLRRHDGSCVARAPIAATIVGRHLTMRRMLGKTGVFCNGLMFGMITDGTLYVRVD